MRNHTVHAINRIAGIAGALLLALAAQGSRGADRKDAIAITRRQTPFPEAMQSGRIQVEGDPRKLGELLLLMDNFEPRFKIVEPKRKQ